MKEIEKDVASDLFQLVMILYRGEMCCIVYDNGSYVFRFDWFFITFSSESNISISLSFRG